MRSVTKEMGNDTSIARTQYWTLLIHCFHRMGNMKEIVTNVDK